jgi:hypothetical protein
MLTLKTVPGLFTVHRFPPHSKVIPLLQSVHQKTGFQSLTVTPHETSFVCDSALDERLEQLIGDNCIEQLDSHLKEGPFKGIHVGGTLDFSLIGILQDLATTFSEARVSIFAISTYDTDWIFFHADAEDRAMSALQKSYKIEAE